MVMAAPILTNMWPPPMPPNRDVLTLAQWLSPAYPVGAFAYSHGLEAAIGAGQIADGAALQGWLGDVVAHGSGRNDCILLHRAYHASDPGAVNDIAIAFCPSAERLLEAEAQGAAFGKTTAAIWGGEARYLYPVAVGAAAARLKIDPELAAAMFLHAVLSNLISASQRMMALGQTEGQQILAALMDLCEDTARETTALSLDDLHSTAFLSDIAAMHHETQQPRIFRS